MMNFDLVRPCGDCPFRSDKPGYLKPERIRSILGGGHGRAHWPAVSFPCHKTIDYVGDDRAVIPPTAQQCAGVMIILTREGRPNDAMQIAQRLGLWNPSRLDMEAPVHRSVREAMEATRW
jgi:hypothetical protein